MAHFLLLGAVCLHSVLLAIQHHDDERESNYLEYAQRAAWASDACFDAEQKGASPARVALLKEEMEDLERKRDENI